MSLMYHGMAFLIDHLWSVMVRNKGLLSVQFYFVTILTVYWCFARPDHLPDSPVVWTTMSGPGPGPGPVLRPVLCPGYQTCLISRNQHRTLHRTWRRVNTTPDCATNYANFSCHSNNWSKWLHLKWILFICHILTYQRLSQNFTCFST